MNKTAKILFIVGVFFASIFGAQSAFAEGETCETIAVNDVCVATFSDALTQLTDNVNNRIYENNVIVYADLEDAGTDYYIFPQNANITIDFNGHNVSVARQFVVFHTKVSLVGQGVFSTTTKFFINLAGSSSVDAENYTVFSVGEGVVLESNNTTANTIISMALSNSSWGTRKYGVVINLDGTLRTSYPDTDTIGIFILGTYGDAGAIINIGETGKIERMDVPVYAAGGVILTSAGEIHGITNGIEVRSGELNITGGSITVDAETKYDVGPKPTNGSSILGAAIVVSQHTTKMPITINISGGTFTADKAFVEANVINSPDASISLVTGVVTGGTFISTDNTGGAEAILSEHWTGFISGGTYSVKPKDEYIAPGYELKQRSESLWEVIPEGSEDQVPVDDDTNPAVPDTGFGAEIERFKSAKDGHSGNFIIILSLVAFYLVFIYKLWYNYLDINNKGKYESYRKTTHRDSGGSDNHGRRQRNYCRRTKGFTRRPGSA